MIPCWIGVGRLLSLAMDTDMLDTDWGHYMHPIHLYTGACGLVYVLSMTIHIKL
jgi:hypothetical protein